MIATIAAPTIRAIRDNRNPRRRERTICPDSVAQDAIESARESGQVAIEVAHGGSVPGAYNYPAWSQWSVAIADPSGRCAVWSGEYSAKKCTHSGALAQVAEALRPLADSRYGAAARESAADFARGLLQGVFAR